MDINVGDLVDFGALIILYFLVFYQSWRAKGKDVFFVNTLMYIYLAFVLYFALMPVITALPFIFNHPYVPMNMEPFIDVALSRGDFDRQIILNVIMTVPFGFLLPLVSPKNTSFAKVVFLTLLLSLSIELIQPLLSANRSSDITDIITNVTGGAVGYILYLAFRPITSRVLGLLQDEPKDV